MADVTKVKASNGQIFNINDEDDYTKEEVDTLLAGKADVGDSYTKAEEDALLADKADSVDVAGELALKANVVDVYSKTEANNLLAGKADAGVSYTKAEDDALLAGKADVSSLDDYTLKATFTQFQSDVNVEFQNRYTKTEDDALLANKANGSDVYTKAEVDALIGGIKMFPDLDWDNPVYVFDNSHKSYTASEDCYLFGMYCPDTSAGNNNYLDYNSTHIVGGRAISSDDQYPFFNVPLPVRTGDTISTSGGFNSSINTLAIYKERSV